MQINVIGIADFSETLLKRLRKRGEVKVFSTFLRDRDLKKKIKGAEILIIQPRLHIDIIPYLDRCRMISVMATGYDAINLEAVRKKGIVVCNVPEYASEAVAEYIFALILALSKKIYVGFELMKNGLWRRPAEYIGRSLYGKKLGIFGFGHIGQRVSRLAQGFSTRVMACTKHPDQYRSKFSEVEFVTFRRLLSDADILVLAAPVTAETKGIFDREAFQKMKKSAFFINTARGALVVEKDLAWALNNQVIAGAGLDVYVDEPPAQNNSLLKAKNIIFTPHVAWGDEGSVQRLLEETVKNVEGYLDGKPRNVVS